MSAVSMELVVGTYDEVLLGFHVVEVGQELQLEASFTDHSHAGCVKCVAISRKGVLASGSTDETIRLLNIKKKREMGSLAHHYGTVTSLQFHKGFLFSTSEDNNLCLWKTFTWECLRTFKGHKAAVDCVSVHPSGKLALTVGRDRALHTWNLITGRSAFITNLKQVADKVQWSPDGDMYAIVISSLLHIYCVETAELILQLNAKAVINCLQFLNNDVCCYGGGDGQVIFHHIGDNEQLHILDTKTSRIKGLCIGSHQLKDMPRCKMLSIASIEGVIQLYKIIEDQDKITTELLIRHETGFRVTCLAMYCYTDDTKAPVKPVQDSRTESVDENNSDVEDSDSDNLSMKTQTSTEKNEHCVSFEGDKRVPVKHKGQKNRKRKRDEGKASRSKTVKEDLNKSLPSIDKKPPKLIEEKPSKPTSDGDTVSFVSANKKKRFNKKKKSKKTS